MIKKIARNWFLLGLVLVCLSVVLDPTNCLESIGRMAKNHHAPSIIIFLIFIISGMMLDSQKIKTGIGDLKATICALIVIVIFAPVLAFLIHFFLSDTAVIIGLFIVSAMPTTLSSGVVMTQTAGGNMAHALFVTIVSNIIAIFSIPVILSRLSSSAGLDTMLEIDKTAIISKLCFLVLLPLFVGLLIKIRWPEVLNLKKINLTPVNQCLIFAIVFVSTATAKNALTANMAVVLSIVILVVLFHLLLLLGAAVLIRLLKLERGRSESVLFMGAQKTLPLSVMIQVTYFNSYGLALVVCICHHIAHLIIDGYLSVKLKTIRTN